VACYRENFTFNLRVYVDKHAKSLSVSVNSLIDVLINFKVTCSVRLVHEDKACGFKNIYFSVLSTIFEILINLPCFCFILMGQKYVKCR
jgi:hypothetical protein